MGKVPEDVADVLEAAVRLFRGNARLTTWEAVEQILERLAAPQLNAVFRASVGQYAWCAMALSASTEHKVLIGIEQIAAMMRQNASIRGADSWRFQRPVSWQPSRRPRR